MNDEAEIKKIKNFARKNKLKVVSAGYYHKWCDKCVDASPVDLLGYFKYAKYVVTDTFHGSVMSLITNANFAAKIRGNKNKLYDLLERFDLSGQVVEDFGILEKIFADEIDYKKVNDLMDNFRKSSLEYLNSCLNMEKNKND